MLNRILSTLLFATFQTAICAPIVITDFKNVQPSLIPLAEATKNVADRYIKEGKAMGYEMVGIPEKNEKLYTSVAFEFKYGDMSGVKFMTGELDGRYTVLVRISFQVKGVDGTDTKAVNKVKAAFDGNKLEFDELPTKGGSPFFAAMFWGDVPRDFKVDMLNQTIDSKVNSFLRIVRSKNPQFKIILREGQEVTNLRRIMDGTGVKYMLDSDGDAKVIYSFGESNRKQQVWIQSKLREVGSFKIRRVYSYGHAGADTPDQKVLSDAMIMNHGLETSRWSLLPLPDDNLNALVLTALVPEGADSATLARIIEGIGVRADNFEEKHFKEDNR